MHEACRDYKVLFSKSVQNATISILKSEPTELSKSISKSYLHDNVT